MSNLLSEAIVDAKALRDAALKNAETIVIEKYSTEVRDTLEKLLEQPEAPPPVDLDADMGPDSEVPVGGEEAAMPPMEEPLDPMAETEEPAEEISEDDIPLGATNGFADLDGKNLGSFPADGQDVELNINLGALQESVDELTAALQEEEEYDISEENIAAMVAETLGAATKDGVRADGVTRRMLNMPQRQRNGAKPIPAASLKEPITIPRKKSPSAIKVLIRECDRA